MKTSTFRKASVSILIGLIFTACQKETFNKSGSQVTASDQSTVVATAQNEIAQTQSNVKNLSANLGNVLQNAGINRKGGLQPDITTLTKLPIFKSLNAALRKTGLDATLATPGLNATVFAPTDDAFAMLPAPFNNPQNIEGITDAGQIDFLTNVLLYHVLGSEVKSNAIAAGRSSATTLKPAGMANDNTIYLSKQHGLLAINGNTLVVFANIPASNGIVHIVNHVLMPPTQTIADIATGDAAFSALVAALVKTNLVGLFQNAGDYTVFAPTDDAFAALPEPFNNATNIGGITDQAQIDALANILKYHVLGERYFTIDLGILTPLTTLAMEPDNNLVGVYGISQGRVKGNQNYRFALAKPANILATNGVVHVVNQVLQP